jgi:biotin carboxylase
MTVFILGAGVMQIPAIRAAKELGWTVVAADANPDAPGTELADRFLPVDLKDREGLAAAARGIRAEFGLDGVFTAGTDFSASVAYVAKELGLPGIGPDTALKASNKLEMRAALARAGVPSPRFVQAASPDDPAIAAATLGFPLVVKPVDSMGARGCRVVRDGRELVAAVAAALPHSRSGKAIVEEYIEGPEFSIDALVDGDEILIRGIADRHIFFEPYFVELGHTMPSAFPSEIQTEVLRVFRLAVRALGIRLGAAKGDMKYCPSRGHAVVGEIAARLSGGYMSGWTYPYASGIDVTREALRLCVGSHLDRAEGGEGGPAFARDAAGASDRGWVSAERAFISVPGAVASIEGCVEAERMPYIKQLFLRVGPGDRVVFPSNNVQKCGNVISQAPTRAAAVEAAESAARAVRVRLAPGDAETEVYLRGKWGAEGRAASGAGNRGPLWPPFAFSLEGEAERALEAMPEYSSGAKTDVDLGAFRVAPFAFAGSVPGRDWSGRGFAESAELALALARDRAHPTVQGAPPEGDRGRDPKGRDPRGRDPRPPLAGRFWRALARGGLQAALYVLDTEAAAANAADASADSATAVAKGAHR